MLLTVCLGRLLPNLVGEQDFTFETQNIEHGVYRYMLTELKADEAVPSAQVSNLSFAKVGKHYHSFAQEYRLHKTYWVRKTEDHLFKGFGQVMPMAEGTMLGAMGNHYTGPIHQVGFSLPLSMSFIVAEKQDHRWHECPSYTCCQTA